jgi:hypothetical protein
VDRNGKFWFNCTPISEVWINDEFCPPSQNVLERAPDGLVFDRLAGGGATRFIITWSIGDNPYNSKEAIVEFEAGLTREERECRIFGLPLHMAGLIYKEFVYDVHVLSALPRGWKGYSDPPRNYTIRVWFDYHIRLPQAVLFFATDPQDRVYVYDELFCENLLEPTAEAIKERLDGRFVVDMEIDPLAVIPHPVTEESIIDELAKYELYFEKSTKDRALGINKVRERLSERDPQGQPTIFFSPHLTETIYEFSHFVYDLKTSKPVDDNDHMMENLYRAILNGLHFVDPEWASPTQKPFAIGMNPDLRSLEVGV